MTEIKAERKRIKTDSYEKSRQVKERKERPRFASNRVWKEIGSKPARQRVRNRSAAAPLLVNECVRSCYNNAVLQCLILYYLLLNVPFVGDTLGVRECVWGGRGSGIWAWGLGLSEEEGAIGEDVEFRIGGTVDESEDCCLSALLSVIDAPRACAPEMPSKIVQGKAQKRGERNRMSMYRAVLWMQVKQIWTECWWTTKP